MSTLEKFTPQERATSLFGIVSDIDDAMRESNGTITKIEGRGVFQNVFSSSREDLLAYAQSQQRINGLLVKLNQEVVATNMMGYTFLASVVADFVRQVDEGRKDSDGRLHVLSRNGKEVARMATEMFNAILDGSRLTQERIDANSAAVQDLDGKYAEVTNELAQQAARMSFLEDFSATADLRFKGRDAVAQRHGEMLDRSREAIEVLTRQQTATRDQIGEFKIAVERDRAALRDEITSLREQLINLAAHNTAEKKSLLRTMKVTWTVMALSALTCLVMGARAFGFL